MARRIAIWLLALAVPSAWLGSACRERGAPNREDSAGLRLAPPGVVVPPVTPFAQPPRLLNFDSAAAVLLAAYRVDSSVRQLPGRVVVWLQIDTLGRVTETRPAVLSGLAAVQQAMTALGPGLRFEPARSGSGAPVPAWVQLPANFHPGDPPRVMLDTTAWLIPRYTRFAQAPQLAERARSDSLMRAIVLPVAHRGLYGSVMLDILLSATGAVLTVQVAESSGHPELDDAVRGWAQSIAFTPALDSSGRPMEAWISHTIRIEPTKSPRE